jgi:hypothetical protein
MLRPCHSPSRAIEGSGYRATLPARSVHEGKDRERTEARDAADGQVTDQQPLPSPEPPSGAAYAGWQNFCSVHIWESEQFGAQLPLSHWASAVHLSPEARPVHRPPGSQEFEQQHVHPPPVQEEPLCLQLQTSFVQTSDLHTPLKSQGTPKGCPIQEEGIVNEAGAQL